jgi:hypothetical protein
MEHDAIRVTRFKDLACDDQTVAHTMAPQQVVDIPQALNSGRVDRLATQLRLCRHGSQSNELDAAPASSRLIDVVDQALALRRAKRYGFAGKACREAGLAEIGGDRLESTLLALRSKDEIHSYQDCQLEQARTLTVGP